jgi:hypothetical protein
MTAWQIFYAVYIVSTAITAIGFARLTEEEKEDMSKHLSFVSFEFAKWCVIFVPVLNVYMAMSTVHDFVNECKRRILIWYLLRKLIHSLRKRGQHNAADEIEEASRRDAENNRKNRKK